MMSVSINHNRKSHTGFRLTSTLVNLNDLERRNSPYFAYSIALQADYVTLVEAGPIMSAVVGYLATDLHSSRTVSLRQLSFVL